MHVTTGELLSRSSRGRLGCTAHMLQLTINDALHRCPEAGKMIKESNSVVVFLKRSLYWSDQMKKVSDDKSLVSPVLPTHKINSIWIRWNSTYLMLRRLAEETI